MGETNATTSALATSVVSTNAMGNYFPMPNLAHQLPIKLTSTNFLLWKTQFLPMICGCSLNHYIDGSEPVPPRVLDGDQPNPAYKVWVRQDQLVLSWIVASVSESILPQLVGAETARAAREKLVAAYATGSKPLIRELKAQLHNLRRDNATTECYVQGALPIAPSQGRLNHVMRMLPLMHFMCGRGRGSTSRGRGHFSSHGSSPQSQSRHYAPTIHSGTYSENPQPSSDFSGIVCHNCEGKGHNARVCPSPRTTNGNRVSGRPSSNLASASSQAAQNWLMDSGTTHHQTSDLNNLAIHSAYHGPEEVTLDNGSKFSISHIGKESLFISDKSYVLDSLLHDLETRATLHKGPIDGGLYSLPILKSISSPASYAASLGVWHARLVHTSYPTDDAMVPTTSTNDAPLTVQIPSPLPQPQLCLFLPYCTRLVLLLLQSMQPYWIIHPPLLHRNALCNLSGNQVVDFEQSSPLSDVNHPNKLSCSSSKSYPMTTRSQTSSLKPKCPTSYLAMSTNVVEPSCYSQATKYAHWRREMQEEYNALLQNGTWQLVPPFPSQNIIGSKWIFKTKVKPDGSIDRYKARLVAKGYHQRPGVDYVDTFSQS
ncbi:hypothetical protein KY285_010521 [Solanum tuberosum]|nr:hypothetical protein KY289_011063 [Solanum tuberosum]KAH0734814.1 hypothetical protein KY285_010521 [Solanum tuberosum]